MSFVNEYEQTFESEFVEVQSPGEGGTITVDKKVIEGSENPVAGGAVKEYVDEQISKIEIPDSPSNHGRIANVEILANKWVGTESPYSQVVSIDGITKNSQVNLTPSIEQLTIFYQKDLAFVTENVNGVVTVYAIGDKPANDYIIQATILEVSV